MVSMLVALTGAVIVLMIPCCINYMLVQKVSKNQHQTQQVVNGCKKKLEEVLTRYEEDV